MRSGLKLRHSGRHPDMTYRRTIHARGLLAAACVSATLGLTACGTLNSIGDINEYVNSDLDSAPPREYITAKEISRIKVGMTPLEIRNRLGPPLLYDESLYARLDQFSLFNIFPRTDKRPNDPMVYNYVFRDTSSGKPEFVPFAVRFQTTRTLGLISTTTVKSYGPMEKPVLAKFDTPATMAAPAASTSAIPEAEPVVGTPVAAAPAPAPAPEAADSGSPTDDIIRAVQSWAQAWAGKDADAYIGFYTADFDNGMGGRSKWETQRRQRLGSPQSITLSLSDIRITPRTETLAEVSFRQEYSSNLFKENGIKTLVMTKADGQWKIRKETFKKQ